MNEQHSKPKQEKKYTNLLENNTENLCFEVRD